jgi:hypothetical protein
MNHKTIRSFQKRLLNSRFFTISLFLHVLLILAFGGTVLFNKYVEPPDFTGEGGETGFVSNDAPQEPPAQSATEQSPEFTPTSAAVSAPSLTTILTTNPAVPSFTLPTAFTPSISPAAKSFSAASVPEAGKISSGMTPDIAKGIAGFTAGWSTGKGGGFGTSLRERTFKFTAYLAKYGNPNDRNGGDWYSTNYVSNGKITGGSLPNLIYFIQKFSKDKIKATADPVPLDLSNWDEIATKKPPFIFFTGHRDFVLSDKEVENLQKYLRLGGCVWGDSAPPGLRSRFDIAFRREMKRVIPDVDKQFEPLPPNHPIFTRAYYPEITEVPAGLNFYRDPVFALKVYGEIAILYTPNDYDDMWLMGLDDQQNIDMRKDERGRFVAINQQMWQRRDIYFRNLTRESLVPAYKFGTNIVVHLLTRWEDKVRTSSHGL